MINFLLKKYYYNIVKLYIIIIFNYIINFIFKLDFLFYLF